MARYEIRYIRKVKKELRQIPNPCRKRIVAKILKLSENPRPTGCEKLTGAASSYRIRIGVYRVIYTVHDKELVIVVVKAGHRKDVYKSL